MVAAKRRTILALYNFECVYTALKGLPTFPCDELMPLPAPASKLLWQSRDRQEWDLLYKQYLDKWKDGLFLMRHLMGGPQTEVEADRFERWLGEVDEFGMMMVTVVHSAQMQHSQEPFSAQATG